jgi:hypothetical protein
MTGHRHAEIEAIAWDLLDDAQHDIEDSRRIYNGLRDALIALVPHVTDPPGCSTRCALPPVPTEPTR